MSLDLKPAVSGMPGTTSSSGYSRSAKGWARAGRAPGHNRNRGSKGGRCHFQRGTGVHCHRTLLRNLWDLSHCPAAVSLSCHSSAPSGRGWEPELLGTCWCGDPAQVIWEVPFCLEPGQQDSTCVRPQG